MRKESNRSVNSIAVERRGRPVMLGEIDTNVKAYIVSLRNRGGDISRTIAIGAAKAFSSRSNDPSVRNMVTGETWAQNLFRRMGTREDSAQHLKSPFLIKLETKLN